MSEIRVERRSERAPAGIDRRQRKQDPWRTILNWLAYVIYPLLLINLFIFIAVASEDQKESMVSQLEGKRVESATVQIPQEPARTAPTSTQRISGWVQLHAFLPIMAAGVILGVAGIVIDRKRARRRSDSSLMTPLVLSVLSVVGLLVFFVVRAFNS